VRAVANPDFPGIARATALSLLRPPYSQAVAETIRSATGSGDPLVRLGALRAMPGLQQDLQVDWAAPLLSDRVRAVRVLAAERISPMREILHVRYEPDFARAVKELEDSLLAIAERPEAQVGLGNLYAEAGDPGRSEAAYRRAMQLDPTIPGPRANLADLYRRLDRDADAETLLREGLAANPDEATYRHALGLLLVRQGQPEAGLEELRRSVELQPGDARFAYVYAVALNSLDRPNEAIDFLDAVKDEFPGDFDIHWALATMLRDQGRTDEARTIAGALLEVYPGVVPVQNLLQNL
jgi:tetratricopeptide (TPR) repeat protein